MYFISCVGTFVYYPSFRSIDINRIVLRYICIKVCIVYMVKSKGILGVKVLEGSRCSSVYLMCWGVGRGKAE